MNTNECNQMNTNDLDSLRYALSVLFSKLGFFLK